MWSFATLLKTLSNRVHTKRDAGKLTARRLRASLWALIACMWSPLLIFPAFAAGQTTGPVVEALIAIPPALVGITWVLSTLAGATALVIRIDRELSAAPDKPLPRPWLFCTAHMLGSWLAGALAFIVGQQQQMDVWLALGVVITFSFTGAKSIEWVAERYLAKVAPPATPA